MEPPDDVADELYGLPFEEFVARRKARARELRSAGDRDAAAAVAKLRKPTRSAWAVNQIVRQERETLQTLLAAGAALRQAQSALAKARGDARALHDATHDERVAVDELTAAAARILGGPSGAVREEVRETLHAAATDEEAGELVRRGRLVEPLRAVGLGGLEAFAGAAPAPRRAAAKPARAKPKPKPKPDDSKRKRKIAAAEKAMKEAERELRAAQRALAAAEARAEAARAAYERERA